MTSSFERRTEGCRLLKRTGSWLYCTACGRTVAYVCYTGYAAIALTFRCSCGGSGELALTAESAAAVTGPTSGTVQHRALVLADGRYRCPDDRTPIFSTVASRFVAGHYSVVCASCRHAYSATVEGVAKA